MARPIHVPSSVCVESGGVIDLDSSVRVDLDILENEGGVLEHHSHAAVDNHLATLPGSVVRNFAIVASRVTVEGAIDYSHSLVYS